MPCFLYKQGELIHSREGNSGLFTRNVSLSGIVLSFIENVSVSAIYHENFSVPTCQKTNLCKSQGQGIIKD